MNPNASMPPSANVWPAWNDAAVPWRARWSRSNTACFWSVACTTSVCHMPVCVFRSTSDVMVGGAGSNALPLSPLDSLTTSGRSQSCCMGDTITCLIVQSTPLKQHFLLVMAPQRFHQWYYLPIRNLPNPDMCPIQIGNHHMQALYHLVTMPNDIP